MSHVGNSDLQEPRVLLLRVTWNGNTRAVSTAASTTTGLDPAYGLRQVRRGKILLPRLCISLVPPTTTYDSEQSLGGCPRDHLPTAPGHGSGGARLSWLHGEDFPWETGAQGGLMPDLHQHQGQSGHAAPSPSAWDVGPPSESSSAAATGLPWGSLGGQGRVPACAVSRAGMVLPAAVHYKTG